MRAGKKGAIIAEAKQCKDGVYEKNIGSIKAFEKCGFKKAYTKKDTYFFDDQYIDAFIFELYNENFSD